MLNIQGLYAGYSGTSVLNDVSLEVRIGEVTVIVGPNGCGKSTLLKAIVGIVKPTDGNIFPVDEMTAQERAKTILANSTATDTEIRLAEARLKRALVRKSAASYK